MKRRKMHIKVGDNVEIISGSDKKKTGQVTKIYHNSGKIIIEGINFKFKHIRPNNDNEVGKIKQIEAPIHHSNVKLKITDL